MTQELTMSTESLQEYCISIAKRSRSASRAMGLSSGSQRDDALRRLADALPARAETILVANQQDVAAGPDFGLTSAQIERLTLNQRRIQEMSAALLEIAAQPDPLHRVLEGRTRPNGLDIQKVTVPLGVILFIYESRPNVTTDAAGLSIKSGNAIILRGGKEARHSNAAVGRIIAEALSQSGLPADGVLMVDRTDRAIVGELLKRNDCIDLAIPRGGEGLIRRVAEEATMPVMKHFQGICHVYVDRDADLQKALDITENSKCHRVSVCNAAETLLVDHAVASTMLPALAKRLLAHPVELRGCEETCRIVPEAKRARVEDYDTEYLDYIMSVRVVEGVGGAIEHIHRHGSGHTEAIVTENLTTARRFQAEVDASAVMVNASTRFNDGGQIGLGAEIGISTDKFHARGPCGVESLTSYKYLVSGNGQVRS